MVELIVCLGGVVEAVDDVRRECRCVPDVMKVFGYFHGYIQIDLIVVNTIFHILDSVSLLLLEVMNLNFFVVSSLGAHFNP